MSFTSLAEKVGHVNALQIKEILKLDKCMRLEVLNEKTHEFFIGLKHLDDSIAQDFYKSFKKRWNNSEKRITEIEKELMALEYEDCSMEEGRQEILGELLDKACQCFEVFDEHKNVKILFGHRLVLEAQLLQIINNSFDLIQKICDNFDHLRGNKHGIDNERDMLRYEIRLCDVRLSEIHEHFLMSYLEMKW